MVTLVLVASLVISCGEPEPLRIGVLVPDTGAGSGYSEPIRRGLELAVSEINAAGGVLGDRPLELVYRDTGTNAENGKVVARELIDNEEVYAIIGPVTSSVALAVTPIMSESEIILLSPAASSPVLTTQGGDYFFRNYPSDVVEGHTMAEFCRKNVIARVAVLEVDDIFGSGIADVFAEKYEASTRRIVAREKFDTGIGLEEAEELAEKVKESDPQAIYIAAYENDVVTLLQALDEIECKGARLATSAVTRSIVDLAGESAEDLIFPQTAFNPADARNDEVVAFVAQYEQRFGSSPGNFAAHAYDAMHVLAKAIDEAVIQSKLRGAMLNVRHRGVTGNIDFDLSGDVVQAPRLYAVLGGEVITFTEYKDAKVGQSILGN
jgi:branched-chain amino acid transport system substrate-binding protein